MKHIKKYLALLLILCFLISVPLSVSASSAFDSYVEGYWQAIAKYDNNTQRTTQVDSSASSIFILNDGSALAFFGSEQMFSATWYFVSIMDGGYQYKLNLSYEGTNLPLNMIYATSSSLYGKLVLMIGDTAFIYSKSF